MCSYGAGCTRKGCVYRHPPRGAQPTSEGAEVCKAFLAGACQFGKKCRNLHPSQEKADQMRSEYALIACRFGDACRNELCLFSHPWDEQPAPADTEPNDVAAVRSALQMCEPCADEDGRAPQAGPGQPRQVENLPSYPSGPQPSNGAMPASVSAGAGLTVLPARNAPTNGAAPSAMPSATPAATPNEASDGWAPSASAAEWTPSASAAEWTPSTSAAEWTPSTSAAEWRPSISAAEWTPSTSAAEWRPDGLAAQPAAPPPSGPWAAVASLPATIAEPPPCGIEEGRTVTVIGRAHGVAGPSRTVDVTAVRGAQVHNANQLSSVRGREDRIAQGGEVARTEPVRAVRMPQELWLLDVRRRPLLIKGGGHC